MASLKWSRIISTLPNRGCKKKVTLGEGPQLWPRPGELLLEVYMIMKCWVWQGPCGPYVNACKGLLGASKLEVPHGKVPSSGDKLYPSHKKVPMHGGRARGHWSHDETHATPGNLSMRS
ncbi:hypothetical protein VNO77_07443 [Canavalia gladiata]|uniref:Uncharacterized protein n=1 Tax=Canavalia gladiata TaxID=3824 RepID=A0AAN9M965_CANGL